MRVVTEDGIKKTKSLDQDGAAPVDNLAEGWRAYAPGPDEGASRPWRLNLGGVGALSRRLIAAERARVLGKRRLTPQIGTLERAARSWLERGGVISATPAEAGLDA